MKVSVYLDVQLKDGYVFVRGVTTDSPSNGQKEISASFLPEIQKKTYRVMFDINDIQKVHRLDIKQDQVSEMKEEDLPR